MGDYHTSAPAPASVAEAIDRRLQLVSEVEEIEAQLADRDRRVGGRRMTSAEYHRWRHSAIQARARRLMELRAINRWLRDRA